MRKLNNLKRDANPGAEEFVETVIYNHHIESILRRCDHDGDAELCYQEFYEVVHGTDDTDLPLAISKDAKQALSEDNEAVKQQLEIEIVKTEDAAAKSCSNMDDALDEFAENAAQEEDSAQLKQNSISVREALAAPVDDMVVDYQDPTMENIGSALPIVSNRSAAARSSAIPISPIEVVDQSLPHDSGEESLIQCGDDSKLYEDMQASAHDE